MHRHFFSLRIAAAVIVAGIAVGWLMLKVNGYAVVHDPHDRIVVAWLVNGAERRPMRQFARGYWAAVPRRDGAIEVTCRDGRTAAPPGSYVTSGMETAITIGVGTCPERP